MQNPEQGTDVQAFIGDLDAGMLERKLSIALSAVAAAVVDNDATGEVSLKFSFKTIPGTKQVHCTHKLTFARPTSAGRATEEETRTTPMHVGKFGRLSLAPETQMTFLTKQGEAV